MVIQLIIWDFAWKTKSLNFQSLTRENIYDEKMKRMKGCSLNYWHWFSSKLKVVDPHVVILLIVTPLLFISRN